MSASGQPQLPVDQLLPDHDDPDHDDPDHVEPDHVEPDNVEPDHVEPDHVEPDHVEPDQVPPDQLLPAVPGRNGFPKMSMSPLSTTPSRVTRSVPRDSSTKPRPVPLAKIWV